MIGKTENQQKNQFKSIFLVQNLKNFHNLELALRKSCCSKCSGVKRCLKLVKAKPATLKNLSSRLDVGSKKCKSKQSVGASQLRDQKLKSERD